MPQNTKNIDFYTQKLAETRTVENPVSIGTESSSDTLQVLPLQKEETERIAEEYTKLQKMYNQQSLNSLKREISNALQKRNDPMNIARNAEIIKKIAPGSKIFNDICHDLTGKNVKAYEIKLTGEEMLVVGSYLLIYNDGLINVYKWNEAFKVQKVREIKTHLLIFLIKTKSIGANSRMAFYNILITAIEHNVERIDYFLECILLYLNVDVILDMQIKDGYLICKYKDGTVAIFDNRLEKREIELEYKFKDEADCGMVDVIEYENMKVSINKIGIEINYTDKSFLEVIELPGIIKTSCWGCYLFILTRECIRAYNFH